MGQPWHIWQRQQNLEINLQNSSPKFIIKKKHSTTVAQTVKYRLDTSEKRPKLSEDFFTASFEKIVQKEKLINRLTILYGTLLLSMVIAEVSTGTNLSVLGLNLKNLSNLRGGLLFLIANISLFQVMLLLDVLARRETLLELCKENWGDTAPILVDLRWASLIQTSFGVIVPKLGQNTTLSISGSLIRLFTIIFGRLWILTIFATSISAVTYLYYLEWTQPSIAGALYWFFLLSSILVTTLNILLYVRLFIPLTYYNLNYLKHIVKDLEESSSKFAKVLKKVLSPITDQIED